VSQKADPSRLWVNEVNPLGWNSLPTWRSFWDGEAISSVIGAY